MAKPAVEIAPLEEKSPDSAVEEVASEAPRVVYVQAPVLLGTLIRKDEEGWWVRFGGRERILEAEPCVDPALLEHALEREARVIIDQSDEPLIVGVVATQRSLVIDEHGCVDAEVERFRLSAQREVLLKTPGAFLRAKGRELEVFGNKVLTRGRELAKVLAAMIEFN